MEFQHFCENTFENEIITISDDSKVITISDSDQMSCSDEGKHNITSANIGTPYIGTSYIGPVYIETPYVTNTSYFVVSHLGTCHIDTMTIGHGSLENINLPHITQVMCMKNVQYYGTGVDELESYLYLF